MIRYGAVTKNMRSMNHNDIRLSRLKLLVIMAKATLKGYPAGDYRKAAIVENARFVFYETLGSATVDSSAASKTSFFPKPSSNINHLDHFFLQRAQLLAVMMNAFCKEKSRGRFRKKAIAENIEQICKYLSDQFQLKNIQFLKVV